MALYELVKRSGAYVFGTGALLLGLYGCDGNSNNIEKKDVQSDVSGKSDLETILEDAGVEIDGSSSDSIEVDLSDVYVNEDVLKTDYVQNEDGSYDIPVNDLYVNEDSSVEVDLSDLYLPDSQIGEDLSENDLYVQPKEDLVEADNSLVDLLENDNSDLADPCANNHAPYVGATSDPLSGSTIQNGTRIYVNFDQNNTGDIDGNLDYCQINRFLEGDSVNYFVRSNSCDPSVAVDMFGEGKWTLEYIAMDKCGAETKVEPPTIYYVEDN